MVTDPRPRYNQDISADQRTSLRRVAVIYNTDYDAELIENSPADVSAVQESARAVCQAVADYGFASELIGVHGVDLDVLFRRLADDPPDLVFNLCESMNGDVRNEALLPTVLEMLKIPYTGADPLSLQLCLHKDRAKEALHADGVSTPTHLILRDEACYDHRLDELDYPFFLKLAHEDASIGIEASNVVQDRAALTERGGQLNRKYRQPVIAERYIAGREVNVTVWGPPHELDILPLHEIDFAAMPDDRPHIVSYAAKWDENHVDYEGTKPVPMKNVDDTLAEALKTTSIAAFRALEMRDFGRVDLRVDEHGKPWVIDVNPNCDLSPDAGVARAAKFAGIDYPRLIGRICEIAWKRYDDQHPRNR